MRCDDTFGPFLPGSLAFLAGRQHAATTSGALPQVALLDPPSIGDLCHWGAPLTPGWALLSGSPPENVVPPG